MLLYSREPMALHCPVIELAPVPGRPMFPPSRARAMIAWASRTPWWLWFTPIVHQNETRRPPWMSSASASIRSPGSPVSRATRSMPKPATAARSSANPVVCAST